MIKVIILISIILCGEFFTTMTLYFILKAVSLSCSCCKSKTTNPVMLVQKDEMFFMCPSCRDVHYILYPALKEIGKELVCGKPLT